MEVRPWFCHPCDDYVQGNMENHFRVLHPDVDSKPQTWPDGGTVVIDETVDEEFFK